MSSSAKKTRISALAEKLGVDPQVLKAKFQEMGIQAKTTQYGVTDEEIERLKTRNQKLFLTAAPTPEGGPAKTVVTKTTSTSVEEGQLVQKTTVEARRGGVIRRRATTDVRAATPEQIAAEAAQKAEEAAAEAAAQENAEMVQEPAAEAIPQPPETRVLKTSTLPVPEAPVLRRPPVRETPVAEPVPAAPAPSTRARAVFPKSESPFLQPPPDAGHLPEKRMLKTSALPVVERIKIKTTTPVAPAERPGARRPAMAPSDLPAQPPSPGRTREFSREPAPVKERRPRSEQLREMEWQETKRILTARREFIEAEVLAPGSRSADTGRGGRRRPQRKQKRTSEQGQQPVQKRTIRVDESITVANLATEMGVKAAEIIKMLMGLGTMVTINSAIDLETAQLVASEFGHEIVKKGFQEDEALKEEADPAELLGRRPPVVTIMGHVDHGKTSLLDAIRETNVVAGESGGITQHIGAYRVSTPHGDITFLDTPGHEAFTTMRARGAKVTDIVVLVVAADDGVKPQTREAVDHARAAGVPIMVAVNKIDKPGANAERVRQQLSELDLLPEEWGGQTIYVNVSAKTREGLDKLLEMLALQAEVLDLKANPDKKARGIVVEAHLDKGRGPVATLLVQSGTLQVGDSFVTGAVYGRVRAMSDERGNRIQVAGPSTPVQVVGLESVPAAGDPLIATKDEATAREIVADRSSRAKVAAMSRTAKMTLEDLYSRIQLGAKELQVVLKGDMQGSVEAIQESLAKIPKDKCVIKVIHSGVGGITESDVMLAAASSAVIIGFHVRPDAKAAQAAERERVEIKTFEIIYDLIDAVRQAMEGLLEPDRRERIIGRAEVREVFNISKLGNIAGCYVKEGKVTRSAQVRLIRDGVVVCTGKLSSLKRFKDDAREVLAGYECGIGIENYPDVKAGDEIEAFEVEDVKVRIELPSDNPGAGSRPNA
ncbi:MAG: translation initiation factor IF-2 [Deltaproteobacteria bacterium]|nr:translation initiation factor IF-2 [Deltaproteobacteria bacterium]